MINFLNNNDMANILNFNGKLKFESALAICRHNKDYVMASNNWTEDYLFFEGDSLKYWDNTNKKVINPTIYDFWFWYNWKVFKRESIEDPKKGKSKMKFGEALEFCRKDETKAMRKDGWVIGYIKFIDGILYHVNVLSEHKSSNFDGIGIGIYISKENWSIIDTPQEIDIVLDRVKKGIKEWSSNPTRKDLEVLIAYVEEKLEEEK